MPFDVVLKFFSKRVVKHVSIIVISSAYKELSTSPLIRIILQKEVLKKVDMVGIFGNHLV